jgi:hypothetical protein
LQFLKHTPPARIVGPRPILPVTPKACFQHDGGRFAASGINAVVRWGARVRFAFEGWSPSQSWARPLIGWVGEALLYRPAIPSFLVANGLAGFPKFGGDAFPNSDGCDQL